MVRSARIVLAVLALSTGIASVDAGSDCTYWQGDPCVPGDWHDAAHWTLGVPTSRNGAVIENGGTALIDSGTAVAQRTSIGLRALPDREVGGTVIQTGGRAEPGYILTLGHDRGSKGVYTLIGGSLSGGSVTVGNYYGSGEFHQIGGISTFSNGVAVGGLRYDANQAEFDAALGLYELSGGQLSSRATEVGCAGRGRFVQSGGSHEVRQTLTVGGPGPLTVWWPGVPVHVVIDPNTLDTTRASAQAEPADAVATNVWIPIPPLGPSQGRYELSGGQLAADRLLIQRTGCFTQTGGAAAVDLLTIAVNGRYEYLGGTLEVSAGLDLRGSYGSGGASGEPNAGILDFGGTSVTLTGGGIMRFSQGSVLGAGEATVSAGPDSLVILPAGFDPAAEFGQFVAQNLVHVAGSDLVIGEGEGFSGCGSIADHVDTRGRITAAAGGGIDLTEGIMVRGGQVDLGSGRLAVENDRSGISAGRLDAGSLTVDALRFPLYGEPYTPPPPPRFTQTGGDVAIAGTAAICSGTYALYGGTMTSRRLEVGGESLSNRAAEFLQAGGTVSASTLHVGRYLPMAICRNDTAAGAAAAPSVSGSGAALPSDAAILVASGSMDEAGDTTYRMQAGRLSVERLEINGDWQPASFVQTGGEVVAGHVSIGGRDDSYVLSGGRLTAGKLDLGYYRPYGTGGTLAILSPAAEICVSERLSFGHATTFLAAPGATIHITGPTSDPAELWPPGSTFSNWSTDPAALSGLGNLKLIFEGGLAFAATLEVAGEDRGAGYAGFFENFALDTLQIGGAAPAPVRLVDLFDNHPELPGREALYVKTLIIGPDSSLDLNGLTIYYLDSEIAPGAHFTNGAALPVPEPATLALLAVGAALLLRRRPA